MSDLELKLVGGNEAVLWLTDSGLSAEWNSLYESSARTNTYLSPKFSQAWASAYAASTNQFMCAYCRDAVGQLVAFMPLMHSDGAVTFVAGRQAEYHGWLSNSEVDDAVFLRQLMAAVAELHSPSVLRLLYLLLDEGVIRDACAHYKWVDVRRHRRPLMQIDSESIAATLKKKGNRSKLNRLRREGELTLTRVTDEVGFEQLVLPLFAYYDLRQGAKSDSTPFHDDPYKAEFHRLWATVADETCVVSVLCLDGRPISLFFGVRVESAVANAIVAHVPQLQKHSISKFHIYLLAEELAAEGLKWLDLTPGGDAWKERFADDHADVFELNFIASPFKRCISASREWMRNRAVALLRALGLSTTNVKSAVNKALTFAQQGLVKKLQSKLLQRVEYRMYRLNPIEVESHDEPTLELNNVSALAGFEASESHQSRAAFLATAATRLENNDLVYTIERDGVLDQCGWVALDQTSIFVEAIGQEYRFDEPGALLYGFYCQPRATAEGDFESTLRRMLADLKSSSNQTQKAYISVAAGDAHTRRLIESLGFEYIESICRESRFGRTKVWCAQVP